MSPLQKSAVMLRKSRRETPNRQGAVIPLIALLMVIFVGMVAFSVDIAYMELARTELRVSTDAAARAAGEALTRLQDVEAAKQAARDVAGANRVAGSPLLLDDSDIVFGSSTYNASGSWEFTPNATPINSVRVRGRRTDDAPSGNIPLFFGSIFNVTGFGPTRSSTVVRQDRDVCIVVDRSSSMKLSVNATAQTMSTSDSRFCATPFNDSRWMALVGAVQIFNDTLDLTPQTEFVGLVSYASDYSSCGVSNTDADINQTLTGNTALIASAMNGISATKFNGNTNIAAGIDHGITALTDANSRPFARKTMILMTDGHRTAGGDPVISAAAAADENIIIHTITYGAGANQGDMQAVANATGGRSYHAPDEASLENIFRELALSISVTFID